MVSAGIAQAIIEKETVYARFEQFCLDVIQQIEGGATILPTSTTWDLGRDGRSVGRTTPIALCCSLADRVDPKLESDIRRATSTDPRPTRLYFCSSQRLSEKRCRDAQDAALKLLPENSTVEVLGSLQLAELALRDNSAALHRHYSKDLDDLRALLTSDPNQNEVTSALELALCVHGHGESQSIRSAIYAASLRRVLAQSPGSNAAECSRDISNQIHLARPVPQLILEEQLGKLVASGMATESQGRYTLTPAGLDVLREEATETATQLLDGRTLFRQSLETAIGQSLSEDHARRIWNIAQERITTAFFRRGRQMVEIAVELLKLNDATDQPATSIDLPESRLFAEDLANAIAATSDHPDQRSELHDAVSDLFLTPNHAIGNWLVRLCASFVSVCSLGLEYSSSRALSEMIQRTALILDTDIILSLLCSGEPDHTSVATVCGRWTALGGRLLVAQPVLAEAAHHAWIAENDYREIRNWLPGTQRDRDELISNAFARAFAYLVANGSAKKTHWTPYINQFRGDQPEDTTRLMGVLQDEYRVELLPAHGVEEGALAESVFAHLDARIERGAGQNRPIERDKARRDADLYASMVAFFRRLRASDPSAACYLVSSSRRLAEVEKKFAKFNDPRCVIPSSVALYLVSLIPDVSVSISGLRTLLFEGRAKPFHDDLERKILRVIRESDAFAMPWAKRSTLMREVRKKLVADAAATLGGPRPNDSQWLEERAFAEDRIPRTATILKESLDRIAVNSKVARENVSLRATVAKLEDELRAIKTRAGR